MNESLPPPLIPRALRVAAGADCFGDDRGLGISTMELLGPPLSIECAGDGDDLSPE